MDKGLLSEITEKYMNENEKLPISVGILSFKAYKTIDETLAQYKNFLDYFSEAKIFFQTFCEKDKEIADRHHVDYLRREENIGIQSGIRWIVENSQNEYILYLENDFHLLNDVDYSVSVIRNALNMIKTGTIDMMRLRSRFIPGSPYGKLVYTKYFKPQHIHPDFKDFNKIQKTNPLLKYIRPFKARRVAASSLYIEEFPEKISKYIKKIDNCYVVDSCVMNWTNNPTLISKKLLLSLLDYADSHPSSRTVYGFQDLEKPLNCRWWRNQHFRIGVCDGIFTHQRLDR